jgi:hypothetical protein
VQSATYICGEGRRTFSRKCHVTVSRTGQSASNRPEGSSAQPGMSQVLGLNMNKCATNSVTHQISSRSDLGLVTVGASCPAKHSRTSSADVVDSAGTCVQHLAYTVVYRTRSKVQVFIHEICAVHPWSSYCITVAVAVASLPGRRHFPNWAKLLSIRFSHAAASYLAS